MIVISTLFALMFIFVSEFLVAAEASATLDDEVTDIQLRAKSGAQSKWSASLFLHYAGASLADPFDDHRPNPEGYAVPEPVSAAGSLGFRYRKNKNESFYLASGFYQEKPLREENKKIELNTPQINYNNTGLLYGRQVSQGVHVYITTQDYLQAVGDLGSLAYSLSALQNVKSEWRVGLSGIVRATFYNKHDEAVRGFQTDYGFTLTPSLQFDWSQQTHLYTSLNVLAYNHFRDEKKILKMKSLPISQSFGVGWAIFRDFYISPSMQFDPERLSRHSTSVNLSLTVNL